MNMATLVFVLARSLLPGVIVPCDQAVQSSKRGLAVQGNDYPPGMSLTRSDLDALAPGVSWVYNWSASTDVNDWPETIEFLPMAWGRPGDVAAVAAWLVSHPDTSTILTANEPNLGSQANLSAADCATFVSDTVAIADGRLVVGPHLAAGTNTTTYRNDVHLALAGGLSAAAIHIYESNLGGFTYWSTSWPHAGWPAAPAAPTRVWVKELNIGNGSATEDEVIDFMIAAVDLLERDPRVERYAWWKDRRRVGGGFTRPASHFMLSGETNGVLTRLGTYYVAMPVHEPDLYYALPGRLEAERYTRVSGFAVPASVNGNVRIARTDDTDGLLEIADLDANEWVEWNVYVATAGDYRVEVRGKRGGTSATSLQLTVDGGTIANALLANDVNAIADTTIAFPIAGEHVLRLTAAPDAVDVTVNWLSFVSPDGGMTPVVPDDDSQAPDGERSSGCDCAATRVDLVPLLVIIAAGFYRRYAQREIVT